MRVAVGAALQVERVRPVQVLCERENGRKRANADPEPRKGTTYVVDGGAVICKRASVAQILLARAQECCAEAGAARTVGPDSKDAAWAGVEPERMDALAEAVDAWVRGQGRWELDVLVLELQRPPGAWRAARGLSGCAGGAMERAQGARPRTTRRLSTPESKRTSPSDRRTTRTSNGSSLTCTSYLRVYDGRRRANGRGRVRGRVRFSEREGRNLRAYRRPAASEAVVLEDERHLPACAVRVVDAHADGVVALEADVQRERRDVHAVLGQHGRPQDEARHDPGVARVQAAKRAGDSTEIDGDR